MAPEDVAETVKLFAQRRTLLRALADGPKSKAELESHLDVSRSTVDRAVRSLEAADVAERGTGGVRLTPVGRIALGGFDTFIEGLEGLERAKPVLQTVSEAADLPFELFVDALVVVADRSSPNRPMVATEHFLQDVSRVRSAVSSLLPGGVERYHDAIVEGGLEAEFVLSSPVLSDLLATFWAPVDEALDTGRVTLYEVEEGLPYSIILGEADVEEAAVVLYGDRGVSGFVRTDRTPAVEWARAEYERVKAAAERVAPAW